MSDTTQPKILTAEQLHKIKMGETLEVPYDYSPVLEYEDDDYDEHRLFYKLGDGSVTDSAYAGTVNAGETLWHAVRRDLEKDFGYPAGERIMIDTAALSEDAKSLRIGVLVMPFDTSQARPAGLEIQWEDDDFPADVPPHSTI